MKVETLQERRRALPFPPCDGRKQALPSRPGPAAMALSLSICQSSNVMAGNEGWALKMLADLAQGSYMPQLTLWFCFRPAL